MWKTKQCLIPLCIEGSELDEQAEPTEREINPPSSECEQPALSSRPRVPFVEIHKSERLILCVAGKHFCFHNMTLLVYMGHHHQHRLLGKKQIHGVRGYNRGVTCGPSISASPKYLIQIVQRE